jgi:hypothetical protein
VQRPPTGRRRSPTRRARLAVKQSKPPPPSRPMPPKRAKGFLNMQVTAGADMVAHVVGSARIATENLEQEVPQLAGLVRSVADRAEEFSQDLRGQTVEDLIKTASDFTRKQPALVFGLASLAGFLAFRVLKSRPPEESAARGRGTERFERRAGQQGGQFRGGQFHGA